jgi:alkylation response protein AidB-like acyl-CoA dehydrogenase
MDFRLTDEQRMVRESARALLQKQSEPAHVKEIERRAPFYDEALWKRAGDLGWLELATDVPSTLDATLLCEELGRASAPIPFLSNALVARALQRGGASGARERWLSKLTAGQAIGAVAITDAAGRFDAGGITARALRDEDGWRISGEKMFVADGLSADVLLVAAHVGENAPGDASLALFAVDATSDGVVTRALDTGPGIPLAAVVLEGARVNEGDVVAAPGAATRALRELYTDAAVLGSALMLGHAAAACDTSVAYAKTREQFGVLIGTFQAVQHRLADMATDVETLRALVNAAAWKRAHDEPDAELAASTAKAWGAEVLERVVAGAHQVHAGIGYTDDHDIQLHTRRSPWYAAMFGDTRSHYANAAQLLGL